jgi:hypothetical protein
MAVITPCLRGECTAEKPCGSIFAGCNRDKAQMYGAGFEENALYEKVVPGEDVKTVEKIVFRHRDENGEWVNDMYCEPHASQIWDWHEHILRLEESSIRKALDVMVTMDKEEWVREAVRASPDKVKVGEFGGEEKEKWFKAFVCEAAEMNVWERKIQIQLLRSFIR